MTPVGFAPTISGGERPQTEALEHMATGTGIHTYIYYIFISVKAPLSGPQNQHFNYLMRSITLHTTPCLHIRGLEL